jgi:protein gp37
MKSEWVVSIRDQCSEQKVPFFFKQWGGVQKKKYGRLLDGKTYDELPPVWRTMPPTPIRAYARTRLAVVA